MEHGMEPCVAESPTEEDRAIREPLKRKHVDDADEYETENENTSLDMISTAATNHTGDEDYVPPDDKKPMLSNEMSPSSGVSAPVPENSYVFKIPEVKGIPRKIVAPKKKAPTIMLPGIVFSSTVAPPVQIVRPVVEHYPRLPMMYALPVHYPATTRVPQPQQLIEREIERKNWENFLAWENKYNYYGALYTKRDEQH